MSDSRAAAAAPAVRGEGVRVAYRSRTVVDVPCIELAAGKTYALLGASGAGKSTLLRVLGLLERPTRGRVLFDGTPAATRDLASRRRIAAVFQKPYLLRGTVSDNVGYGLRLRSVGAHERASRVEVVLQRVGLAGWQDRSALTLSGGEAQRVALARALVLEPSFLLLDEPLSYMDPLLKRSLSVEFAAILAGAHVTSLYVTHDQDEAAVMADRIGIMREGKIVTEGGAETVLGLPADEWLAAFVGMEPSLRGRVAALHDGLSEVDCDGITVYSTTELPVGTPVLVAVRPEDVTVYEADAQLPVGSARNHLEVTVAAVRPQGGTVHVALERAGARFAASVSRAAAAELDLKPGQKVVAVFKATAVRMRSET
jgi:tungstate transport system ATP-binding protein